MNAKKTISAFVLALSCLGTFAQAPANSEDVMLQGFYWDSQKLTGWTTLSSMAAEIGKNFTCIWLPPSASAEGGGPIGGNNVGYHPRQWNSQTSCWGSSDDLKTLISSLHQNNVRVIADIVINHRAGDTDWGNFTADNFGQYGSFQLTADNICSNDEMNTDPAAGSWNGKAKGAPDTGENWNGARDLDHTSDYVQQDCKAYLAWLKGEFGYDGWRYDYCKGYDGKYVGIYNLASKPYISVGEYWDGSYDNVASWIEATGKESMAFDFPAKYAALNDGLAKGNFSNMSWIEDQTTWRPAGMIHHRNYNRYAVTFVDNHDSYRDGNKYTGNVPQAYAFILASPGIPCVFWPHWRANQGSINQQIAARHKAGITSQSDCQVTQKSTYYESITKGRRGYLICRIGTNAPTAVPAGYEQLCSGYGWAYYFKEDLTGISNAHADGISISATGNTVSISSTKVVPMSITTLDGRVVFSAQSVSASKSLPHGVYIVTAGSQSQKVSL